MEATLAPAEPDVPAPKAEKRKKKQSKARSPSDDDLLELEGLSLTPQNPLLVNPLPGEPLRRVNKWTAAIPPNKPVHEQFKGRSYPTAQGKSGSTVEQERLGYLCDVVHELDAEAPLFKPDQAKFTTMLEYKVQCLEKAVRDSNLMMGAYCQSSETSHQNHVRKHHVSFKEGKLRLFAWSVISTMLNAEARRHLVPSNMTVPDTAATAEAKPSAAPIITSGNKAPKKRKVAMAKGTPSITAFFKAA
ncbi:methionine aminopeptidase, putative [Babesia caballi]|uniref:Methionine aminopeptidase, putative n=1 Tax=Babesia caballi TaxID=5871 RepID=A0AAV4LQY4_BABCB|nr:methionine aminopeptidase, putative [Babesia caballi]